MFSSSRCSLHRRAHKVPQLYKQDHLSTQADGDVGDDGNRCIHGVQRVFFVMLWNIYKYYELFANPEVADVLFSHMHTCAR